MHSRIYEISDRQWDDGEVFCGADDVPEWFTNTISDYVCDVPQAYREENLDYLAGWFGGCCTRDGNKLMLDADVREKVFEPMYNELQAAAANLMALPYRDFCGVGDSFNAWKAMYRVKSAFEDKYGYYAYNSETGNLITMHEWLRGVDPSKPYYVGGIIDYHW